ncbi:MAG: hypothetical protein IT460_03785, partial [Planctomycetes bacterium]|nr:hypothetical protein [Planctomycetota bacterium]
GPPPPPIGPPARSFVHYETPPVSPIALSPDGTTLLVTNLADARLEIFSLATGTPVWADSVFTGLDPVSVRFRGDGEAWVVNHVSDSVSVVDLATRRVRATLATQDEPCDVAFAGSPVRAFVSCSQANTVLVFDPADLAAPPSTVAIDAEDPRALAVSPDGRRVYAAVFESGNGTTVLGGGIATGPGSPVGFFPPNVVSNPATPHGGVNPAPNASPFFDPPLAPLLPPPPAVSLIVRKDAAGAWRDDTGASWTPFVSGASAAASGRPVGWDLPDRDVAVIDTATLGVTYVPRLMNVCMDLAVDASSGNVYVVGTDATNERRFEPKLSGRFLRVLLARVSPSAPAAPQIVDLNPHLTYATARVAPALRAQSIGDPRAVVVDGAGGRVYVAGMGSDNLVVLDLAGARTGSTTPVALGRGPAGLALDVPRGRLYAWNRFEGTVSVVDTATRAEVVRVPFFDPTPAAVRDGRALLYDTHAHSGLGHVACGSCHVDARSDRLGWDLGDPSGAVKPFAGNCGSALTRPCEDHHPMKGPMTTQTLQDIVGHEPFHWRGDRDGLEEFAGAFVSLQGGDVPPTSTEMAAFKAFLATIAVPPNPFRGPDNALPASLPLPGHFTPGRFGAAGQPLPVGDAVRGLALYRTGGLEGGLFGAQCVTCHTLPTGMGSDMALLSASPLPLGPNGEHHLAIVSVDGGTNVSMKVPHLRTLYDKVGCDLTQTSNRAGFGFLHDGSVDSLARFVAEPLFRVRSDQEVADLVAFLLAFSGGDLPAGTPGSAGEPLGPTGHDSHAAVGRQVTLAAPALPALLATLLSEAQAGRIDLVVKARRGGEARGWVYDRATATLLSDRDGESISPSALRASAVAGSEQVWTAVPRGVGVRLGRDRDEDGFGDRTELDAGKSPTSALDHP